MRSILRLGSSRIPRIGVLQPALAVDRLTVVCSARGWIVGQGKGEPFALDFKGERPSAIEMKLHFRQDCEPFMSRAIGQKGWNAALRCGKCERPNQSIMKHRPLASGDQLKTSP